MKRPARPRHRRVPLILPALALALALTGAGCGSAARQGDSDERLIQLTSVTPLIGTNQVATARTGRSDAPAVILISVDGLNPNAITRLDRRGKVPTFRRLLREGVSTLNARTTYERTNTLPNHTAMLTGRPIWGPTGTRVAFNESRPGTLRSLNGRYVPGLFDPLHDAGYSTAFLAEKPKFRILVRSWSAHGQRDPDGTDYGRDKLDLVRIGTAHDLTEVLLKRIRRNNAPNFTFLHIAVVDHAGHADHRKGFMGPKYLRAVRKADREIRSVIRAIESRPALAARATVIVTSDHGGKGIRSQRGKEHRNPAVLANYRVPFIVWGPGIPAGQDLYDLNAETRQDPGTRRVRYVGPQPVRNLDAANLALSIFGLDPLPQTAPANRQTLLVR